MPARRFASTRAVVGASIALSKSGTRTGQAADASPRIKEKAKASRLRDKFDLELEQDERPRDEQIKEKIQSLQHAVDSVYKPHELRGVLSTSGGDKCCSDEQLLSDGHSESSSDFSSLEMQDVEQDDQENEDDMDLARLVVKAVSTGKGLRKKRGLDGMVHEGKMRINGLVGSLKTDFRLEALKDLSQWLDAHIQLSSREEERLRALEETHSEMEKHIENAKRSFPAKCDDISHETAAAVQSFYGKLKDILGDGESLGSAESVYRAMLRESELALNAGIKAQSLLKEYHKDVAETQKALEELHEQKGALYHEREIELNQSRQAVELKRKGLMARDEEANRKSAFTNGLKQVLDRANRRPGEKVDLSTGQFSEPGLKHSLNEAISKIEEKVRENRIPDLLALGECEELAEAERWMKHTELQADQLEAQIPDLEKELEKQRRLIQDMNELPKLPTDLEDLQVEEVLDKSTETMEQTEKLQEHLTDLEDRQAQMEQLLRDLHDCKARTGDSLDEALSSLLQEESIEATLEYPFLSPSEWHRHLEQSWQRAHSGLGPHSGLQVHAKCLWPDTFRATFQEVDRRRGGFVEMLDNEEQHSNNAERRYEQYLWRRILTVEEVLRPPAKSRMESALEQQREAAAAGDQIVSEEARLRQVWDVEDANELKDVGDLIGSDFLHFSRSFEASRQLGTQCPSGQEGRDLELPGGALVFGKSAMDAMRKRCEGFTVGAPIVQQRRMAIIPRHWQLASSVEQRVLEQQDLHRGSHGAKQLVVSAPTGSSAGVVSSRGAGVSSDEIREQTALAQSRADDLTQVVAKRSQGVTHHHASADFTLNQIRDSFSLGSNNKSTAEDQNETADKPSSASTT